MGELKKYGYIFLCTSKDNVITKKEALQWAFKSRENLDKLCSAMRCAVKNNPKISNFDEAFEEIKQSYYGKIFYGDDE